MGNTEGSVTEVVGPQHRQSPTVMNKRASAMPTGHPALKGARGRPEGTNNGLKCCHVWFTGLGVFFVL